MSGSEKQVVDRLSWREKPFISGAGQLHMCVQPCWHSPRSIQTAPWPSLHDSVTSELLPSSLDGLSVVLQADVKPTTRKKSSHPSHAVGIHLGRLII